MNRQRSDYASFTFFVYILNGSLFVFFCPSKLIFIGSLGSITDNSPLSKDLVVFSRPIELGPRHAICSDGGFQSE
ncbi:hypothetical protein A1342_08530 [Methylomonas methanica]|uniref:Uncharacterized protein n=1 Tax=Methylomonas denitrificans TaxID=1538553 RepID=A0A126T6W2_9GAMM|nr:hypothetical protein JT25_015280 [Methylomonas denitrificans]OAI08295.1 hypothetical protein A1342_08530 [Methylomonas methanica]